MGQPQRRGVGYVAGGQIGAVTRALGSQYRADAASAFVSGYHLALMVAAGATLLAAAVAAVGLRAGAGASAGAVNQTSAVARGPASVEGADSRL
jgi:hypothetical protein